VWQVIATIVQEIQPFISVKSSRYDTVQFGRFVKISEKIILSIPEDPCITPLKT